MTKINIQGSGGASLPDGNLKVDNPLDNTLQVVKDTAGTGSSLSISTEYTRVTGVGAETCPIEVVTDTNGAGIAFQDTSTTDLDQVGVGAFGDLLCLRGGGNVAGTVQIGNDFVNVRGHELRNFVPTILTENVGAGIDSSNQDVYCASVLEVTGAINIQINDDVRDGFSISVIQMDANQCTFIAGGTLTLQNRQGHTQTAGQWATVTLFKNGNNLILAGDTA